MAEMQSLVPLDTPSLEDEVIVLEDDYDLSLHEQSNEIIDHAKSNPQPQHRRKKRLSDARQWVMQHIFKKNSSTKKNNVDDHNVDHGTPSAPSHRPASITVQPQHHEDGILENDQTRILSYEQYQHEKRTLIGQGLSGLSNPNIARALGVPVDDQHQASLASLLFSTSTSSSCTPPVSPSNSNAQQHHHIHCHSSTTPAPTESQITTSASLSYQKRDSGVSVLSKPNQHHHRHQHHRHPTSSSITANTATTTIDDVRQQHHHRSSRSNSKRRAQSMDSLVSVRYPKMVHVKVLRGAAIHALSSSDMLLAPSPQPTDSIPDCCIMPDKSTCCCSS